MDAALAADDSPKSRGLMMTALAPLFPQILGSAFNIPYNAVVIAPLLEKHGLKARFLETIILYNALVYPLAVAAWLWVVFSLRPHFRKLEVGAVVEAAELDAARRRVVHLPWIGSLISAASWLLCIPVFLIALGQAGNGLSPQLLWHLPISVAVSAFIATTQSFFLIELASHRRIFPVFFRGVRPDQLSGIHTLSLRGRGLMWAISGGVCPIVSLLLLSFAPPSAGNPAAFEAFVGGVGIVFGLVLAVLISRLVAEPVDQLRAAAQAVASGRFDVQVPLRRADEFGALIGEFNWMVIELREKERLRQTFGLHVGRKAAEQILARDPGLSGTEQTITVMFVDIRGFTARAAGADPAAVVTMLNEFLRVMVQVVEGQHSGMINKFLGDGFMALFGAGTIAEDHADEALRAGREMLVRLSELNARFAAEGHPPLAIGIGLHTGPAIVGSIGSPERLEFTAIGNTVNLASRIENLTKNVGETLLVSDATRAALRDQSGLREVPRQRVKGVEELVAVWAAA